MNDKATQPAPSLREAAEPEACQAKFKSLELELEQKNVLLEQGFAAFTEAAEKLQESHKGLQKRIDVLTLELEEKNRELEDIAGKLGFEVAHFNLQEYLKGGALLSCMVMHINRLSNEFSLI